MCRSIKVLRQAEAPAANEEIAAAALQYVRKISGYHKPSRSNEPAFSQAVEEIAASSSRLLESLKISETRQVRVRARKEPRTLRHL